MNDTPADAAPAAATCDFCGCSLVEHPLGYLCPECRRITDAED